MAFTGLLMAYYRQSKRRTAEFLSTLLGQPCCPALTVKMQAVVSDALRGTYDELAAELPSQDRISADEKATKEANKKVWLWAFVAPKFSVFAVRNSREAMAVDELHGHRDWLWMFVRQEGIEPTNNAGERALRHAVIWRKLSFGTQSAKGSRFAETMLTVIETCRQQGRPVFDFPAGS